MKKGGQNHKETVKVKNWAESWKKLMVHLAAWGRRTFERAFSFLYFGQVSVYDGMPGHCLSVVVGVHSIL